MEVESGSDCLLRFVLTLALEVLSQFHYLGVWRTQLSKPCEKHAVLVAGLRCVIYIYMGSSYPLKELLAISRHVCDVTSLPSSRLRSFASGHCVRVSGFERKMRQREYYEN